jgi:hypothetical protein
MPTRGGIKLSRPRSRFPRKRRRDGSEVYERRDRARLRASGLVGDSCAPLGLHRIGLRGGTLYYPGAVEWDAIHGEWVVFDQLCGNKPAACSYTVSTSGVLGTATTYDNYEGGSDCDLIQGEIADRDRYVVGSDYEYCGDAPSTFNRWAHAAGGDPANHAILSSKYSVPNGVAISVLKVGR